MTRWATTLLLMHRNKDRRRGRPQLVAIMDSRDDQIAYWEIALLLSFYLYIVLAAASRLLSNRFSDSLSLAQNYARIYDGIQRATRPYKFRGVHTAQRAAHIGDTIHCASWRGTVFCAKRSANDISLSMRDNILSVNCNALSRGMACNALPHRVSHICGACAAMCIQPSPFALLAYMRDKITALLRTQFDAVMHTKFHFLRMPPLPPVQNYFMREKINVNREQKE